MLGTQSAKCPILLIVFFCAIYATLNVTGATFIKFEVQRGTHELNSIIEFVKFFFSWRVIVGLFFIFVSALVMFKALSLGDFTTVVPVSQGINFALTILIGVLLFKDPMGIVKIGGLMFIIMGILLMGWNGQ